MADKNELLDDCPEKKQRSEEVGVFPSLEMFHMHFYFNNFNKTQNDIANEIINTTIFKK